MGRPKQCARKSTCGIVPAQYVMLKAKLKMNRTQNPKPKPKPPPQPAVDVAEPRMTRAAKAKLENGNSTGGDQKAKVS